MGNKFTSRAKALLAATLILATSALPATAVGSELGASGSAGTVPVEVTAEAATFNVTIPTSLPVHVSADGTVTTADSAALTNGGAGRVRVTDVSVAGTNGWGLVAQGKDWTASTVGLKEASFTLNSDAVPAGGGTVSLTEASWPAIPAQGNLPLEYSASVAPQPSALTQQIASIVFTVGWDAKDAEIPPVKLPPTEVSKAKMDTVLKPLTGSVTLSAEAYKESYANNGVVTDVSAAQDMSAVAVVNGQNAVVYPAEGMKLAAPQESRGLFFGYYASTLDLHGLDTSNVTVMGLMFAGASATTITGINTWDTSSVTDVEGMFTMAKVTELDLSNFDLAKGNLLVKSMFTNAKNITTVIVGSEADETILRNNTGLRAEATITVAPAA